MKIQILLVFAIIINTIKCNVRVKRIVGGIKAAQPPFDDPVVFVRLYSRDARVEGVRNLQTGLYSFFGIRYADSPIGENRFARPQYKRLAGDINATRFGPPCPQPDLNYPHGIIGDEDCLLLNIYTPQMPDETTGLPVIIWIHGGGFRYGSAAQYGATPLTAQNLIFVPIQYRLGSLGILGDGTKEFSGNAALFDMAAAIRWVREYISFFGGNPENIKIMGQGSGATSAVQLSMSPLPRDMISGVIAMSGTPLSQYSLDKMSEKSVQEVSVVNNCPNTNETEFVKCMREKSTIEIINMDSNIQLERLAGENMMKSFTGFVGVAPTIEEADDKRGLPGLITTDPSEDFKKGFLPKIPLMTGVCKDETANGIIPKELESIWKSLDNFLSSISSVVGLDLKDFLKISNITGQLIPFSFPDIGILKLADYLKIPKNLSPDQILGKLVETTTDMFFNLPAFLTVNEWSKFAPTFLYRFEYKGKISSGKNLLSGLPLVSKSQKADAVAHGDELSYLFDICDIYGNPIAGSNVKSEEEIKVQKMFTNLIAEFAAIKVGDEEKSKGNKILSSIFKPKGSSYIKISNKITLENDFQFCQLSVIGAPIEAIKTTTCKILAENLAPLTDLSSGLSKNLGLDGVMSGGASSLLSGIGGNAPKINPPINKKPGGLGLGLF